MNKLHEEVIAGNPGAMVVLLKLRYFTKWYDMVLWLKKSGYVGPKLWELYKDEYHENHFKLGEMIKQKLYEEEKCSRMIERPQINW